MTELNTLNKLFQETKEEELKDFFTFLKFKSISTESEHREDLIQCATWLKDYISKMGFETQWWENSGHPIIFASYLKAGPHKPTLLIYNHYDVQPVDPIELWESPPFEPTIRKGEIYARGAQDNKGQCFYVLQALKLLLKKNQTLPINIKLCIEGEEEAGSAGLSAILKKKKEDLTADYLAIVDVGIRKSNQPAITLGVRGILTMDVKLTASHFDLHSGSHGGVVYNPIHALVEILSQLRDKNGAVTVPGFYDDVISLKEEEKGQLSLDFDPEEYQKMFGALPVGGEKIFSPIERAWVRPTLEINGIAGGYSGSGFKTVIPAKAIAKISCRLVPNQDPQKIGQLVADAIKTLTPHGLKVEVELHPGVGSAVRSELSSPLVQAFSKAYHEIFGKKSEYIFDGASIPIINKLAAASGASVVLVGLGLPDDQIHAPNEHFGIDRIEKGCLIMARTMELLSDEVVA